MTRPVPRSRKVPRRPSASSSHVGLGQIDARGRPTPKNRLLLQLQSETRDMLLHEADYVALPLGRTFARVGDAITAAYFPDSGLLSFISEMTTGHQIVVDAVGAEGLIGLGALLGMRHYPYSSVTLVPSHGYLVRADRLLQVFGGSEELRRSTLAYVGRRMSELVVAAACNRVHSHRQRLARWLLVATDKAQQRSLPVTHDVLAQMVGGPRHAVTVALNQLRTKGAIAYRRGFIDVLNRSTLVEQACECYDAPAPVALR